MSDESEDKPEATVGYGKPPKAGQFTKGQSGNPRGRPRKKKPEKREWLEARFPTREVLRAEAARAIAIRDASGRKEITTTEAVMRSLAQTAMKGGVFAQRTFLDYVKAEDERLHEERRGRCEFWSQYKADAKEEIEAARKKGEPEPDFLPHPEDIVVDWHRLEVRFLGAIDEDQREAEKQAQAYQRLGFEMSIYLDEDNCLPCPECPEGRIGPFMAMYLLGWSLLPPRLRLSGEQLETEILPPLAEDKPVPKALLGEAAWGDDLKKRCEAANVPFVRWHKKLRIPTIPIDQMIAPL